MSISPISDISDFVSNLIDEMELNSSKKPYIILDNKKIEVSNNLYCIEFSELAGKIGEKFIEQSLNSEYFSKAVQCAREILISKGYIISKDGSFYLKKR